MKLNKTKRQYRRTVVLPFPLRRHSRRCRACVQHIFNKDAVAAGGVADEDVGDGIGGLAVLDYRRARHECG